LLEGTVYENFQNCKLWASHSCDLDQKSNISMVVCNKYLL